MGNNSKVWSRETEILSATQILSRSFDIYLGNFGKFIVPFIIVGLITGIIQGLASFFFGIGLIPSMPPVWPPQLDLIFISLLGSILLIIIMLLLNLLAVGMTVKLSAEKYLNREISLKESLNFALEKLGSLILASILVSIIITIGFALIIIPGIIFSIWFIVYVQFIIIEKQEATTSMSSSKNLTSGHWGHVFLTGLLFLIVVGIATAIITIGLDAIKYIINLAFGFNIINEIILSIITSALTAIFIPLISIGTTILYYDLKKRKNIPFK